jgi:transposase
MWTEAQRKECVRPSVRYPSDLSDAEWAQLAPLIPPARRGGRPRTTDMREALNGLLYLLRTGCQWRYLPKDFPPRSTIYNIFRQWQRDGDWDRIHHALRVKLREAMGREASPSAGIIDSQSVKSAEKGGSRSTRWVMTRARRSRAANATLSSTRRVSS